MRDFNHSVGVLVKAYMNNTLHNGLCQACAVGNLIADARGYKIDRIKLSWLDQNGVTVNEDSYAWLNPIRIGQGRSPILNKGVRFDLGLLQVKASGYSTEELGRIERVFEEAVAQAYVAGRVTGSRLDYFEPLMAVIDVLAKIHDINLITREEVKKLFVKA